MGPRRSLILAFAGISLAILGLTGLLRRFAVRRAIEAREQQAVLIDRTLASPGAVMTDRLLPAGDLVIDLVHVSPMLGFSEPAVLSVNGQASVWNSETRARFEELSPGVRYTVKASGPYLFEPFAVTLPSAAHGARVAIYAIPLLPPPDRSIDAMLVTPEKILVANLMHSDRLEILWTQNTIVVSEVDLPRGAPDLARRITEEWKAQGGHRDPSDRKLDRAIIRVLAGAPFEEILAVARAIVATTREMRRQGISETVPAFDVWAEVRSPVEPTPAEAEDEPPADGSSPKLRPPNIRAGAVQVSGRLPPEVIQRIVRQNVGRVRLCYEAGLRRNPRLYGRVAVRFVIGADGATGAVANNGSDFADDGAVQCIVRSFYGLSFPRPERGVVTVVYPFLLSPG